ncbi:MAG: radical SAM protein [Candidatus Omnitrophota bacterium]
MTNNFGIYPKYLSIQTTSFCNAHCIFCPNDQVGHLFSPKVMDQALFEKIINECGAYRQIERIILYLNNEPLTDSHIVERINYAKDKVPWACVHLLTNGSLLTSDVAERLIDSKLDWIGFSLHGVREETIQKSMGVDYKLTFQRVLDFIGKAKSRRNIKDFVMITFLRHKYLSLEEEKEAIKFWQDEGIERISHFDGPVSRAGNVDSLPLIRHDQIAGCSSIWANEMIHIVENGDVILCCMDWQREVILGNLNNQSIYEIWNSQKYTQVREERDGQKYSESGFICKKCEAAVAQPSNNTEEKPAIIKKSKELDIFLVICPMWGLNMPPIGVSYLHACLKQAGYRSGVLDINIDLFNKASDEYKNLWKMQNFRLWSDRHLFESKILSIFDKEINGYVDKILSQNVKIIGFSVNAGNSLFSIELAKRIKNKDQGKIIVFGGPHSKWFKFDLKYLEDNHLRPYEQWYRGLYPGLVNIFVIGEGEAPLLEIMRRFKNKEELDQIPGTILFQDKYLCFTGELLTQDLNTLPFPDFSWANLDQYADQRLPVLLSRGCIRKCSFCNDTFVTAKYRCRSAESVFEEIKLRIAENKINNFEFLDLILNGNLPELEKLCDFIINKKINVNWSGQAAIRNNMSLGLLRKMKKAGCACLTYGAESFSDKVLRLMNKPYTYKDIKSVLKNTAIAGIRVFINIVVGFPGEGEEEFRESTECIKQCSPYIDGISSLAPCLVNLGSALHSNPEEYGIIYPGEDNYFNWHTLDGNNYALRKKRAKEILAIALKLNLAVEVVNLYDEADSEKDETKELVKLNKIDKPDMLLVICPPWGIDAPPLGIASLSTYLREKGFKTEIFDFNIYLYNKIGQEYRYLWEMGSALSWRDKEAFDKLSALFDNELEHCVDKIVSWGVDLIGFSILSNSQDRITTEIIKRIKNKNKNLKVILGGTSISIAEQRTFFEKSLSPELIDFFVIGEGEEVLGKLIEAHKFNKNIDSLGGVLVLREEKHVYLSTYLRENLDDFPFPTFSEFNLQDYLSKSDGLAMEWSRGCISSCGFCAFKVISGKIRKKSPQYIIKAISYYKKNYNINHLSLVDSAVDCDLKHLVRILDLIISANLDLKFSALALPLGLDGLIIAKMKRAGFIRLEFGVESGSDKVLGAMYKLFTSSQAEEIIKLTHGSGIKTVIYLIVGYPGETGIEFNETLDFLRRNARYIDLVKSVNPFYLMAGSPIYKNYKDYGIKLPIENPDFRWWIDEENNYGIRLERVNKVREILKDSNIKYFTEDNQFEKTESKKEYAPVLVSNYKLDALLVTLPPWGVENPPIGLGYLDAYVRGKGLKLEVYDFNVYFYNSAADCYKMLWHVENKNYWSNDVTFGFISKLFENQINYAVEKIVSCPAKLIGFSVVDPKERITIEVIKRVKKLALDKKIILGGPACSTQEQRDYFTDNIPDGIDYFVVGEGEETLYEIIRKEQGDFSNKDLAGIAQKIDGSWKSINREPIKPIDIIPFPDYRSFNLNQYTAKGNILVEWSRGCLGRCSFCKNHRLVAGYRARSPESIFNELSFLKNNYSIDTFTVCDNLLNGDIVQLEGICQLLIKSNLSVHWSGQIAPRSQMRKSLFRQMYLAGCSKVQIGVESGSAKVLKLMKKPYLPQTAAENIRLAKAAGLKTEIFLLVGFANETEKEFRQTINFVKDNSRYIDVIKSINTLHLIAGTEIYENPAKFNLKKLPEHNWHYLWETNDGNTYVLRRKRVEVLLDLAVSHGIKVQETNIKEGKEVALAFGQESSEEDKIKSFKNSLSCLQELPSQGKVFKKTREVKLWLLLILTTGATLFYIIYFWLTMLLRNRLILGGKKE